MREIIKKEDSYYDQSRVRNIINAVYEKGGIEIAKEYFNLLNDENQLKVAQSEYDKGNIQFIEENISRLTYEVRGLITLRAYEKGDKDFIEKHIGGLSHEEIGLITLNAYEKGDLDFVEKYFESSSIKKRKTIVQKAYDKGDMEFVEKHFSDLAQDISNSIIEEKYKKGDMGYVEKHFSYAPIDIIQKMIFSALDNGDMEYVHAHLSSIQSSERQRIVKSAYEEGRHDFVKEVFFEFGLPESFASELVNYAYQTGDIDFVDINFKYLIDDDKKYEIVHDLYQKGNIKFVNKHLKDVPLPYRDNIILEAMKNGDTEFVEKYYKKMSKLQRDKYLIKKAEGEIISAYENGNMEYVEEYFSRISINMQERLVNIAFEKGDISFVESHYYDLLQSMKDKIVQLAYEKGEKDFFDRHFKDINRSTQNALVLSAYENDEKELVDNYFKIISDKVKVMSSAIEKGDIEFVEQNYDRINSYDKSSLIEMACEKGYMEFVSKHFGDLSLEGKSAILIRVYQSGDTQYVENEFMKMVTYEKGLFISELIRRNSDNVVPMKNIIANYVQEEKQCTEIIGKKTQSRSGKLLYSILGMEEVNPDIVMELINAGSDVNYTAYSSNTDWDCNTVITYTPILMKALEIKDDEKKKKIVNILLETGADKLSKKTELTYSRSQYGNNRKKVRTAMEDEFFVAILNEREQNKNVHSLLTKEIGLSEDEVANIEATFQEFGNSIYTSSYDKVKRQMEILSAVDCEKAGVTKFPRILFLDPAIIYSRLKFFIDNEIEIDPNALHKTLAATNKKFTMEYGKKILETDKIDESQIGDVKRAIQKKYPMPVRKELLKAELDRIKEKYSEKEMD